MRFTSEDPSSEAVKAAVSETLGTIERRARLYRRLVQAFVVTGVIMILLAIFVSAAILLYAPAAAVFLVSGWMALDAAELGRWRRAMKVEPGVLNAVLKARSDLPQRTVAGMAKSLAGSTCLRDPLLSSVALAVALVCGARTIQVRSVLWAGAALISLTGAFVTLWISRVDNR